MTLLHILRFYRAFWEVCCMFAEHCSPSLRRLVNESEISRNIRVILQILHCRISRHTVQVHFALCCKPFSVVQSGRQVRKVRHTFANPVNFHSVNSPARFMTKSSSNSYYHPSSPGLDLPMCHTGVLTCTSADGSVEISLRISKIVLPKRFLMQLFWSVTVSRRCSLATDRKAFRTAVRCFRRHSIGGSLEVPLQPACNSLASWFHQQVTVVWQARKRRTVE